MFVKKILVVGCARYPQIVQIGNGMERLFFFGSKKRNALDGGKAVLKEFKMVTVTAH